MSIRLQEIAAVVAVIVGLAMVPILTWWYEDYHLRSRYGPEVRIIKLTASAEQGRVTEEYVAGWNYWSGRFARTDTIKVNKGEKVVLLMKSADVTHRFEITPELNIGQPIEMEGGHTQLVEFLAEKPGRYLVQCKSFCGCPHHGMLFNIEIVDNEKKNDFVKATAND